MNSTIARAPLVFIEHGIQESLLEFDPRSCDNGNQMHVIINI